jgi:hypothetical protein
MISLIHPSRSRPEKAWQTAHEWIDKAGVYVDYVMSIDNNDPSFRQYFKRANLPGRTGYIIHEDNSSVVEATNKAAKMVEGDVLVYLSDDFKCFDYWALAVENEFEKYSGPTLIKVDDCLQKFDVPVLTIPIMNRECYNALGYFFHPGYKSMFCDTHLYERVKKLGFLKFAPHLKFPHEHHSVGYGVNDETYKRSAANWDQGKTLFAKHKAAGFVE